MNFYTYAYLREDGTPYYIGKGHGKRIHHTNHGINLPPRERRIILKDNLTEEQAFRHEIYLIAVLGRKDNGTGILRNRTAGGDGASGQVISEEQRRKLSESKKGNTYRRDSIPDDGMTPQQRWVARNKEKRKESWRRYNDKQKAKRLANRKRAG